MQRDVKVNGDTALIPLTKGFVAVIDAADAPLVAGYLWRAEVKENAVYARRSGAPGKAIYLHRVIMGEPSGLDVDHRDGDGLNNRRSNLRSATRAENCANSRTPKRNTTGFKGVSFVSHLSRWRARITIKGRVHHLGMFATAQAAADAYADASRKFHGEFGRTA